MNAAPQPLAATLLHQIPSYRWADKVLLKVLGAYSGGEETPFSRDMRKTEIETRGKAALSSPYRR
jgi:hypothetical protein